MKFDRKYRRICQNYDDGNITHATYAIDTNSQPQICISAQSNIKHFPE